MAYIADNLHLNDNNALKGSFKEFQYTNNDDSLASIGANGYFVPDPDNSNDISVLMEVGDAVFAEGSDGTNIYIVTSISPIHTEPLAGSDPTDLSLDEGYGLIGNNLNKATPINLSGNKKFLAGNGTTGISRALAPNDIPVPEGNIVIGDNNGDGVELDISANGAVPMGNGTTAEAKIFAALPVYIGQHTYGGGGTTTTITVTGLTTSHRISCTLVATTTPAVYVYTYQVSANTITVTFSADPGAGTLIDYIIFTPTTP